MKIFNHTYYINTNNLNKNMKTKQIVIPGIPPKCIPDWIQLGTPLIKCYAIEMTKKGMNYNEIPELDDKLCQAFFSLKRKIRKQMNKEQALSYLEDLKLKNSPQ